MVDRKGAAGYRGPMKPSTPERALARAIALRLRALREASGLTQRAVAEALGWMQSMVYRLESGSSLPRLQTLLLLADFYKVPLSSLVASPTDPPGEEEVELLMLLRALPEDRRRAALATVRALAKP